MAALVKDWTAVFKKQLQAGMFLEAVAGGPVWRLQGTQRGQVGRWGKAQLNGKKTRGELGQRLKLEEVWAGPI